MMSSSSSSITPAGPTATSTIPWLARFLITSIEPFFAGGGAITVLLSPEFYLAGLTRDANNGFDPASRFIYTEIAGSWLMLVFIEVVILRLVDDLRVWKLLCMSILISDAFYAHSLAEAVGGWGAFFVLSDWTAQDWLAAITTWPFLAARISIAIGMWDGKSKIA